MIIWKKEYYTTQRVPSDGPPVLWIAPNGKRYFQLFTQNDMVKIIEQSKKDCPQILLEDSTGMVLTTVWNGFYLDPENGDLRFNGIMIPEKWRERIKSFSLKFAKKRNGMLIINGMRVYLEPEVEDGI